MKKISLFILAVTTVFSCKEEAKLTFTEINTVNNKNATIEINIPKANGDSKISQSINSKLNDYIINELNFGDEDEEITLDEAITGFDKEYALFKDEFEESPMIWEASFDGEVIYESENVICIALTSYAYTGGAHGNMNITLYNFNPQTGDVYSQDNLIEDKEGFTEVAKTHFKREVESNKSDSIEDYFFDEEFHLPANIGFNEEGVLILYNTYEIASYANGITEFTIPFDQAELFLKLF